jgi:hypothetical protein
MSRMIVERDEGNEPLGAHGQRDGLAVPLARFRPQ